MPITRRTRTVTLLGVILALFLLGGCGTDRTVTGNSPADSPDRASETTLVVSIEGSSAAASTTSTARWTVISIAHNSTDETMTLQSKHNYPQVFDNTGTPLIAVDGAGLSATNAGPGGDYLGPGGTVRAIQEFDVDSSVPALRVVWDFSPAGKFEQVVP